MYKVWGTELEAADMSAPNKYVSFKTNKDIIVRAVRTSLIVYNDPVFTDLNAKIYSAGDNNTPGNLIYTSSDVRTKAEVHTLANGVKSTYFTFADVALQGNTFYNLVINGTGYIPTTNSYLAWKLGFPDPVYADPDFTLSSLSINQCPFDLEIVAAEF